MKQTCKNILLYIYIYIYIYGYSNYTARVLDYFFAVSSIVRCDLGLCYCYYGTLKRLGGCPRFNLKGYLLCGCSCIPGSSISLFGISSSSFVVDPQVDGRVIFLKCDEFLVILCLAFSAVIMLPFMATMWYGMGLLDDENLLRFRCRTSTSSPI